VDGYVADGHYAIVCLARKQLSLQPFFEEVGHVVDAEDPLLTDGRLRAVLEATHGALGIERGMTHSEVKLTASGPRVIEVNGRIGGDLIPYVGMLATGIDPGGVAFTVATGPPGAPASASASATRPRTAASCRSTSRRRTAPPA
jgi:biotin carboxylase